MYDNADSSMAADGDCESDYNQRSCFHSDYHYQPWWAVDLGEIIQVKYVVVTARDSNGKQTIKAKYFKLTIYTRVI